VIMAAQSGVAGHVSVGSHCILGGRAGVTKDVPAGPTTYMGFPAMPAMEERRRRVKNLQVPDLFERVKELERKQQERDSASHENGDSNGAP